MTLPNCTSVLGKALSDQDMRLLQVVLPLAREASKLRKECEELARELEKERKK